MRVYECVCVCVCVCANACVCVCVCVCANWFVHEMCRSTLDKGSAHCTRCEGSFKMCAFDCVQGWCPSTQLWASCASIITIHPNRTCFPAADRDDRGRVLRGGRAAAVGPGPRPPRRLDGAVHDAQRSRTASTRREPDSGQEGDGAGV